MLNVEEQIDRTVFVLEPFSIFVNHTFAFSDRDGLRDLGGDRIQPDDLPSRFLVMGMLVTTLKGNQNLVGANPESDWEGQVLLVFQPIGLDQDLFRFVGGLF